MGPTSPLVLATMLAAAAGLLVLLARFRRVALKVGAGGGALLLSVTSGLVIVNDHYGYYRYWGDIRQALSNSVPSQLPVGDAQPLRALTLQQGVVRQVRFAGGQSGISRTGYVYLPPQYFEPGFRDVRFPVLELFHGYPGRPADWLYAMHLTSVVNRAISLRQLGPMVLVMAPISRGLTAQECLNTSHFADATFLTTDVRAEVTAQFRVATGPAQWGLLGFSSGGYCAANLALHYPGLFGSAAALDGYFQASDGPAGTVLGRNPAALAANSPVTEARRLDARSLPLPAFWLSVGTANADDVRQARLFSTAMSPLEKVSVVQVPGQGHNFYDWRGVLPAALSWSWQQLSPPDLRVQFPVSGSDHTIQLPVNRAASPSAHRGAAR